MAVRIPTYEDRLTPQGPGIQAQARGVEVTGAVGAGMQNFGNAGTNFAAQELSLARKREDDQAIANEGVNIAKAQAEWPNRVTQLAQQAVDGGNIRQEDGSYKTLTDQLNDEWTTFRSGYLEKLSNPKAKLYVGSQLDNIYASTLRNSIATEANLNVSNKSIKVDEATDTWAKTAAADATLADATITAAKTMIANSGFDQATAYKLTVSATKKIAEAAAMGAIQRNAPEVAQAVRDRYGATIKEADAVTEQGGQTVSKLPQGSQTAITGVADRLGISADDLRAIISYETGGTFDPGKRGGKGNNHVGLIQFGPEEQAKYGINPKQSFEQQMPAVERYLRDRGVKSGDDLKTLYKIINGGNRNVPDTASDGNGTIADHVEKIRREHGGASKSVSSAPALPPVTVSASVRSIVDQLEIERLPAFLSEANTAVNRNNAVWNQAFDRDLGDAQSAYQNSGTWTGRQFTEQDFERRSPGEGARLFGEYQKEQQLGADLQTVNRMGPEEITRLSESYTPTTGPGAKMADARRDVLQRAIATSIKQRADDPAGFAVKTASNVRDAAAALTQSQNQSMEQQRAAADRYALVTTAEQKRLGILSPRLLTDQQAAAIGSQFKQQADGGNDAAQLMKTMSSVWGNNWPRVFGEIYKDLPPVAQVLGALGPQVDAATSALIIQTAGMKPEELKAGLVPTDVTDVGVKTQTAFADFKKTMSWQSGGLSQFSTLYNAAEKLAYVYVGQGMSTGDAAAKAFNNTIGRNYTIVANMRIPKSLDKDQVLAGADRMFRDLPNMQFALPSGVPAGMAPKDAQAQYADGLKSAGIWVTAGDESGLVLYDNLARTPVRTKDGKDVKYTWAQLMKTTPAAPVAYDPLTGAVIGGQ